MSHYRKVKGIGMKKSIYWICDIIGDLQKMKIMASRPITSWQIDGETTETETLFFGAPKSLQMVTAAMKLKEACSLEEKL